MNSERLTASTENREYFFYITEQKPQEISLLMYNTPYTLFKEEGGWRNHNHNRFNLAQHLIDAMIAAIGVS